jgi:hypothetical protein
MKHLCNVLTLFSYQKLIRTIAYIYLSATLRLKKQRTFFCTKKSQKSLIHKITTIGSSVLTAMKITPIIAQSAATNLKNVTRGSFFDQESLKLFLDTQYQKEWTKKKLQIFELNDTLGVPGLISMLAWLCAPRDAMGVKKLGNE